MKKNNIIMILIASLFLIFAGCSSSGDSQQSGFGIGSGKATTSGSGVELTFAEGAPQNELFKSNPTTFAFIFKNFQEHAIEDLELRVKGFDRGYVSGLSESYSINNIPKSSEIAGPGIYPGLIVEGVSVDNFVGRYAFTPKFDYCYTLKSTHSENICVPNNRNQCDAELTNSKKTNGPLSIDIKTINDIGGGEVQITFALKNSGPGQVVNECFKEIEDYATNYEVLSARLGTQEGNCEPQGSDEFILGSGNGNFFCKFQRSQEDSYQTQLVVELENIYEQSKSLSINVVDPTQ